MTTARRTALGAMGVAGIAVASGIVVGLAPASLVGAASGLDATLATGVLGAALVAYALRRRRASRAPETQRLAAARTAAEADDPGRPVDDALEWIAEHGSAAATQSARSQVRESVRETALHAYASRQGVSEAEATDAIATGEWTDDRVAAAFVGDERAPRYPLRERLYGWVRPGRAFRRRAERTAVSVHRLATDAVGSTGQHSDGQPTEVAR